MKYIKGWIELIVVLSMLFGLCALTAHGADKPPVKAAPFVESKDVHTADAQITIGGQLSGGIGNHSPQKIDPPDFELPKAGIVAGGFVLGLFVKIMLGVLVFVFHVALIVLVIVVVVRLLRRGRERLSEEGHPLLLTLAAARKRVQARRKELRAELDVIENEDAKKP
jgi:hypothetical protein